MIIRVKGAPNVIDSKQTPQKQNTTHTVAAVEIRRFCHAGLSRLSEDAYNVPSVDLSAVFKHIVLLEAFLFSC